MKTITIEQAKDVLRNSGYYVDNLWSIDDVKMNRRDANGNEITNEMAQTILNNVFKSEATIDEIWFAIDDHSEQKGLIKIDE